MKSQIHRLGTEQLGSCREGLELLADKGNRSQQCLWIDTGQLHPGLCLKSSQEKRGFPQLGGSTCMHWGDNTERQILKRRKGKGFHHESG